MRRRRKRRVRGAFRGLRTGRDTVNPHISPSLCFQIKPKLKKEITSHFSHICFQNQNSKNVFPFLILCSFEKWTKRVTGSFSNWDKKHKNFNKNENEKREMFWLEDKAHIANYCFHSTVD